MQNHALPDEFTSLDKTRIHYSVVSGRRTKYTVDGGTNL